MKKSEFDILENTEQSVIDRLSAEFPPIDEEEKEKVFRMSERKFNDRANEFTENDEQTVSGVDVYKRPLWKKLLSVAAAAAIIVGGSVGGFKAVKYFTNTRTVSEEEHKTAPFGDFKELDYQLCNYTRDSEFKLIDESSLAEAEEIGFPEIAETPVPASDPIEYSKREKLAELFNDFDYESCNHHEVSFDKETQTIKHLLNGEEVPPDYSMFGESLDSVDINTEVENLAGTSINSPERFPYFVYIAPNEVRMIAIYRIRDVGVIGYEKLNYTTRDGKNYLSDPAPEMEYWEVDYDYFKKAVTDIMNDGENNTEEPTTVPVKNEPAPFGNFSEKDFFIPSSTIDIQIELKDGMVCFGESEVIPLEKRQQLEAFFNSLDYEEVEDYPDSSEMPEKPEWFSYIETFGFMTFNEDHFSFISVNSDDNILTYEEFDIEPISEEEADSEEFGINRVGDRLYRAVGDAELDKVTKLYKVDYELMREKISEILGSDDFLEFNGTNQFFEREWNIEFDETYDPVKLDKEDTDFIYNILRKCHWKNRESLSDEEQKTFLGSFSYASMTSYEKQSPYSEGNIRSYFSIESYSNATFVGYYVWQENENGVELVHSSGWMTEDNVTVVQQLKDHFYSKYPELNKEVSLDLSIMDEISWKDIDFFVLEGSSWEPPAAESITLTQDKIDKLKDCFSKHNWKMQKANYGISSDHVIVNGDYDNKIVQLCIYFNKDGDTMLVFETNEKDKDGLMGDTVYGVFPCGNRHYLCEDKGVFDEVMKILQGNVKSLKPVGE